MFTQIKRLTYLAKHDIKIIKNLKSPAFSWKGYVFYTPVNLEKPLRHWLHLEYQNKVSREELLQLKGWLQSLDFSGHHTNLNLLQEMTWRAN